MSDPIPLRRREPDFCPRDGTPMADRERGGEIARVCPECGFWHGPDPLVMVGLWIEREGEVLLVRRGDGWSLPVYLMREAADPVEAARDFFREETALEAEAIQIQDVFTIDDATVGEALLFLYRGEAIPASASGVSFEARERVPASSSDRATLSIAARMTSTPA